MDIKVFYSKYSITFMVHFIPYRSNKIQLIGNKKLKFHNFQ